MPTFADIVSRNLRQTAIAAALAFAGSCAMAQGFAIAVSPARFEVSSAAAETRRHVLEIFNASTSASKLQIRTADWSLGEDMGVTFHDVLQPGSCRPWVAIERSALTIGGGARVRYRFEVTPPPGTNATECRFAILLEGEESSMAQFGGMAIPVNGRIGVIVYVAVGDAAPQLEIVGAETAMIDGKATPALRVRNSGNAHGRLAGYLSGKDAAGRNLEFEPSSFPVLPGETRLLALSAQERRDQPVSPTLPVAVSGTLEWGSGRQAFQHRFEAPIAAPTKK